MLVYAITHNSRTNGPGVRSVIHLAGCTQGCKGCFSPHTWTQEGAKRMSPHEAAYALWTAHPDGISISGGEPLEQISEVFEMVRYLFMWARNVGGLPNGILLYSGTTERQRQQMADWPALEAMLDAAILGPYMERQATRRVTSLLSSANQVATTYGRKIAPSELRGPSIEVKIGPDGEAVVMGFPDRNVLAALSGQEE